VLPSGGVEGGVVGVAELREELGGAVGGGNDDDARLHARAVADLVQGRNSGGWDIDRWRDEGAEHDVLAQERGEAGVAEAALACEAVGEGAGLGGVVDRASGLDQGEALGIEERRCDDDAGGLAACREHLVEDVLAQDGCARGVEQSGGKVIECQGRAVDKGEDARRWCGRGCAVGTGGAGGEQCQQEDASGPHARRYGGSDGRAGTAGTGTAEGISCTVEAGVCCADNFAVTCAGVGCVVPCVWVCADARVGVWVIVYADAL